ncbi:MAG: RsmB/NOP family class I SAM-dependent RNA methyltransferase [Pseudomonadota bacterium]|nr:RsmB/NOP family class I SAM-dependent RNA methyltransferase [Pseudomonadota bacterium]
MRLGGRLSAAIEILADIEARRRPVADALKDWGLSHRFAGSKDRAAIGNLVYDALRRKRSYGARMGEESPRALVSAAALETLVSGPEALIAALEGDRFAPELPGAEALSRFLDDDAAHAPAAVRADIPDWLAPQFEAAFGEDWVTEAAALSDRPPLDLRVNTLKSDRETVLAALKPFSPEPCALSPVGVRIAPIEGDGRHPNVQVEAGFQKGWFEIQDEGSQLAALLSSAMPGGQVLDFCAGAGGKTLALSGAMENSGQIHAHDADRQRLAPIYERLKRAGVRNAQVHDPRDDLSGLEGAMDIVLIDAPCTGTGTWRRRPDAKWRLSEAALAKRSAEQDEVLEAASAFVKPGGTLLYVTCSVLHTENADRVEAFLDRNAGGFLPIDMAARWAEILPDVPPAYRTMPIAGVAAGGLMLSPRISGTDGFFIAALQAAS